MASAGWASRRVPICQALEFYFDEHTPFRDVKSVRPGEYLLYTPGTNTLSHHRWWRFPEFEESIHDETTAVTQFLDVFTDACAIRKVADVPVTIFLSGGIDSSLIQAIVKCDVSYTVQFAEFESTINERDYVVEFAREHGFEPRIVTPTREEFLETFADLARFIEFPVGSFSVFPLFCVARQARRDGFVVAVSGEGADELFTGYYRNELLLREASEIEQDFNGPYGTLCRRYFGTDVERFCRMASRQGLPGVPQLLDFFRPLWSEERNLAQNLSFVEATVFMQPLLVMADRLAMGNSLEVRNPYLDYRIVEFSTKLATSLRYRDGQGKWLLRQALRRLVGSELGITRRRIKHGLPAPVNQWLFKSSAFDRKDWNHILLGECLKQLAQAHDPTR
jgi:asparagine synthase (glutamine-hydrolysing)